MSQVKYHRFTLGPGLFDILVSDLGWVWGVCVRSALLLSLQMSSNCGRATSQHWAALQRKQARLEERAARGLMKFSRDKCKVLPWGRRNPWGSPWGGLAQSSSVEKRLPSGTPLAEPAASLGSNEG